MGKLYNLIKEIETGLNTSEVKHVKCLSDVKIPNECKYCNVGCDSEIQNCKIAKKRGVKE